MSSSTNASWAGVAALRIALDLGPGHRIVTVLCDSGTRHLSKFWAQIGDIGGGADTKIEDILEMPRKRAAA